jgi:hypothetical protein
LRRRFVRRLERVQARVDGDFIAALDRQLIETSGNGDATLTNSPST